MKRYGTTVFRLYMDYLNRNYSLKILTKFYKLTNVQAQDNFMYINCETKFFKHVVINITEDRFEIYKANRTTDNEFIFLWSNNKVQTLNTSNLCDNVQEYNMLLDITAIYLPYLQKMYIDKNASSYLIEENYIKKINLTEEEHIEMSSLIKRFLKDVESLYGFEVESIYYDYYSYENYMNGLTVSCLINKQVQMVFTAYNQQIRILEGKEFLLKYPSLLKVAGQVTSLRSYARVYRRLLEEESGTKIEKKRKARFK